MDTESARHASEMNDKNEANDQERQAKAASREDDVENWRLFRWLHYTLFYLYHRRS